MNRETHNSLIYISLDLVGGLDKARALIQSLNELGHVEAISSVYKRFLNKERVDLQAYMEFVVRYSSMMNVDQTLEKVLSLCGKGPSGLAQRSHQELILLAFDNSILMSPKLTLPFPHLHTDPLVIRCASEAWGAYEHPIYQVTLSEIARSARPVHEAEFFLQGKSLVDF
jgi:7,8-dihydro-6-hydroxymethylpterin-pyrophosphokinase